jgi:ankyrin repeat protein
MVSTVIHFEPVAPLNQSSEFVNQYFPPYLIPGSSWEVEWRETFPQGWQLFHQIWRVVERGDLETLQLVATVDPSRLSAADENGWQPLFHAALRGHLDLVIFLVEQGGVDVNAMTNEPTLLTALAAADAKWGEDSAISQYLRGHGAVPDPRLLAPGYNYSESTMKEQYY